MRTSTARKTRRRTPSRTEWAITVAAERSGEGVIRSAPRRPPGRRLRASCGGPRPGRRARPRRPARRRSAARPRARRPRRPRTPDAVSTSTPPRPASSSGVPALTSRPRTMIATRSQTSSTSLSRCELSRTATPRPRSSSSRSRTIRRPTGSRALVGSSSSSSRGAADQRLGEPSSSTSLATRRLPPEPAQLEQVSAGERRRADRQAGHAVRRPRHPVLIEKISLRRRSSGTAAAPARPLAAGARAELGELARTLRRAPRAASRSSAAGRGRAAASSPAGPRPGCRGPRRGARGRPRPWPAPRAWSPRRSG